jgi:hypothetical protein
MGIIDFAEAANIQTDGQDQNAAGKVQLPEGVEVVKVDVIKQILEPDRLSVAVVLKGTSIPALLSAADAPGILANCLDLCRKEGLHRPALNDKSRPTPCDKQGKPLPAAKLYEPVDTKAKTTYYYRINYMFLGNDI